MNYAREIRIQTHHDAAEIRWLKERFAGITQDTPQPELDDLFQRTTACQQKLLNSLRDMRAIGDSVKIYCDAVEAAHGELMEQARKILDRRGA